jgi:hypothetical protein
MTTAAPSTALATIQTAFTDAERLALAGFLAGYRSLTREAYALDLRQFTTWCRAPSVALFASPTVSGDAGSTPGSRCHSAAGGRPRSWAAPASAPHTRAICASYGITGRPAVQSSRRRRRSSLCCVGRRTSCA